MHTLDLVVSVDNHRSREESKCLVKSNNQDCLVYTVSGYFKIQKNDMTKRRQPINCQMRPDTVVLKQLTAMWAPAWKKWNSVCGSM